MERFGEEKRDVKYIIYLNKNNMSLEIVCGKRKETIEILERNGNKITILLGKTEYELDVLKTSSTQYSILQNGKSHDISVVQDKDHKNYIVDTDTQTHYIEIVDAESRFKKMKQKASGEDGDGSIISPMPGKIVKVVVKKGDKVKIGEPIVIISAMKMENEFKATVNGVVEKVHVKEGDIVDGGKTLVVIK